MTPYALWVFLGLCPVDMGDMELTQRYCYALFSAQNRRFDALSMERYRFYKRALRRVVSVPEYPDLPTRPRPKQGNEIRV